MVRRGFTLIEMLAVIAILLVVTAITLPVMEDRLAEARFDSAVSRVDSGMAWARAEAQRLGGAMQVTVKAGPVGTGLYLEPLETAVQSGSDAPVAQPFAVIESGLAISDRDPRASGGDQESGAPHGREKGGRRNESVSDAAGPVVFATFLPDGSAMAAGPMYISGFGKAVSLAVNHWTGGTRVTVLDLAQKAGGVEGATGSTGREGARP